MADHSLTRTSSTAPTAAHIYAFHSGGTNAHFGDGSVRFLTANTNIGVLAAVVNRAGNEAVTVPD